jgi:hypothetical protein
VLELANSIVLLSFDPAHAGLIRMFDRGAGVEHVQPAEGPRPLWRLHLADGERTLDLSSADRACTLAEVVVAADGGQEAHFEWRGLDLEGETAALTVRVRVHLPAGSGLAAWRLWVDNRSAQWGLWDIDFPVFSSFLQAGQYDVAFPHRNWGKCYAGCSARLTGDYPTGWSMPMQFCAAWRQGSGVYLAAHDPQAWKKVFTLEPGQTFSLKTYVEDMGVAGSGHQAPFPVVAGVFRGGWLEAATLYRSFAVTAPWTAEGPLSGRRSVPQALKDTAVWFLVSGHIGPTEGPLSERNRPLVQAQEYLGVPLAAHWYNWHEIPFDTHYPHYFPTRPGVAEQVRDLVGRGIVVMPYINGRIVDRANDDFAEYCPFATKDARGELYNEEYGNGVQQAVMCSATRFWQDRVAGIVDRLGGEVGVNAVYIDQIAAAGPPLCFDRAHGHPLGGGGWWVAGYCQLLRRVQEVAHAPGRNIAITSECVAEPFMGGVDAFLVWQPRDGEDIPLMAAVYSGYTLYFASPEALSTSDRGWAMVQGRDFLWGCQNGWMTPDLLRPEHAAKAAFLRQLGQYRVAGRDYLTYGQLVGLIDHPQTVTEPWAAATVTLPVVQGSIWRAGDGRLAVFLVNYLDTSSRIDLKVTPAQYGLQPGPAGYTVQRLGPDSETAPQAVCGMVVNRTETLGPTQIRFLEIRQQ